MSPQPRHQRDEGATFEPALVSDYLQLYNRHQSKAYLVGQGKPQNYGRE